eukprot:s494_g22.t1
MPAQMQIWIQAYDEVHGIAGQIFHFLVMCFYGQDALPSCMSLARIRYMIEVFPLKDLAMNHQDVDAAQLMQGDDRAISARRPSRLETGLPTGLLKQKEIDEKRARKQRLRARKEEAKRRMEAQKDAKEPADRSEEVPEDYKQEEWNQGWFQMRKTPQPPPFYIAGENQDLHARGFPRSSYQGPEEGRDQRVPLVNFSILTPSPSVCQPLHPSRVGSKEAAPATDAASATEEEVKETYTSETRWIIEPQSELRLLVHFTSSEVATYYNNLTFEVVDAVGSGPVSIGVSSVAALPGISSEPRLIFPRFKKRRAEDGYAVKAFVTSLGLYDFGPLLAGRNPNSRIIPVEDPPEAGGEEGAEETVATAEAQAHALSPFVLRHAENLRITNDSLFPANVRLGLASSGGDFAVGDLETISKSPSPFIVEPESLKLEVHQEAEVKIWCFPPEKGVYKDRIVARIEHNAEPVAFDLSALGEMPSISVDKEEAKIQHGKLENPRIMKLCS